MHYKAPDNSLHCIDPEYSHLLPAGCVPITDEEAEALRPRPDPMAAINGKLTIVREVREAILNRLAGIALASQLTGDTATVQAYLVARKGLLDITKDLPTELQDIELAIYGRYQAIVSTVQLSAPALITAFAGVDL